MGYVLVHLRYKHPFAILGGIFFFFLTLAYAEIRFITYYDLSVFVVGAILSIAALVIFLRALRGKFVLFDKEKMVLPGLFRLEITRWDELERIHYTDKAIVVRYKNGKTLELKKIDRFAHEYEPMRLFLSNNLTSLVQYR